MNRRSRAVVGLAAVALVGAAALGTALVDPPPRTAADPRIRAEDGAWRSFLAPADLAARLEADRSIVVIDVRSAAEYEAGHLPGSINLPGDRWRTPSCKPGAGESQYIFRRDDGTPDVTRYERLLGEAGIAREDRVVIVGEHAGKANGSVPAMILDWLGQEEVRFLDGAGVERWKAEGRELATAPAPRAPTAYRARPHPGAIWSLSDVLAHLEDDSVVYLDTRSQAEFDGADRRNNRFGGRIPGAVLLDYAALLGADRCAVDPATATRLLEERGITPDRTVVLYCQTATRVSLTYLVLKDLGFERIRVYDASWHEYGNRDDTPIEARTAAE